MAQFFKEASPENVAVTAISERYRCQENSFRFCMIVCVFCTFCQYSRQTFQAMTAKEMAICSQIGSTGSLPETFAIDGFIASETLRDDLQVKAVFPFFSSLRLADRLAVA